MKRIQQNFKTHVSRWLAVATAAGLVIIGTVTMPRPATADDIKTLNVSPLPLPITVVNVPSVNLLSGENILGEHRAVPVITLDGPRQAVKRTASGSIPDHVIQWEPIFNRRVQHFDVPAEGGLNENPPQDTILPYITALRFTAYMRKAGPVDTITMRSHWVRCSRRGIGCWF